MPDFAAILATALERSAFGTPDADGYPSEGTMRDVEKILGLMNEEEEEPEHEPVQKQPEAAAEEQEPPAPQDYARLADLLLYESHHAPEGGISLNGKSYTGGEFIPAEEVKKASAEDRGKLERRRSIPEHLKALLTPAGLKEAASSILSSAAHPVRTAKAAKKAAKRKLADIYQKYGPAGVAAVGAAYVAYYATALANPVMFTVPVPLTATILTCAEMVRRGVEKVKRKKGAVPYAHDVSGEPRGQPGNAGQWAEAGGEEKAAESKTAGKSGDGSSQTDSPAFKAWFGESKVVGEDGEPRIVFHASTHEVEKFKPKSYGDAGDHSYFYFAQSKEWSKRFMKEEAGVKDAKPRSYYLSIKSPLDLRGKIQSGPEWVKFFGSLGVEIKPNLRAKLSSYHGILGAWTVLRFDTPELGGIREQLIEKGYDGLMVSDVVRGKGDNTSWIAFEPTQIKAVSNTGTFDPSDPRIDHARAPESLAFSRMEATIADLTSTVARLAPQPQPDLLSAARLLIAEADKTAAAAASLEAERLADSAKLADLERQASEARREIARQAKEAEAAAIRQAKEAEAAAARQAKEAEIARESREAALYEAQRSKEEAEASEDRMASRIEKALSGIVVNVAAPIVNLTVPRMRTKLIRDKDGNAIGSEQEAIEEKS